MEQLPSDLVRTISIHLSEIVFRSIENVLPGVPLFTMFYFTLITIRSSSSLLENSLFRNAIENTPSEAATLLWINIVDENIPLPSKIAELFKQNNKGYELL